MSTAKTGTFVAVPAIPVLAAGAILGAGALAIGLAAKGMVRLGSELYDQVDDHIKAKIVKDQIDRRKRFREILKKRSFEVKERYGAEREYPDIENEVISEDSEEIEGFFKTMETLTKDRAAKEENLKMKSSVSDQMDRICKEIKAKREERAREVKAREVQEPNFRALYKEIREKSIWIKETGVYPDVLTEIEGDLKTMEKNRENFGRLISRLNRLGKRIQETPIIYKLADIYNEWSDNSLVKLLKETGDKDAEELLSRFEKAYKINRRHAEQGFLGKGGIDELRETMKAYLEEAEKHKARIIFNEDLENIKEAMKSRGFTKLVWNEDDGYIKISGKRKEDTEKVSIVWIKSLENTVTGAPQLRMEVEGYETYDERKKQNKALIHELESLGLTIDWEETTHDRKGDLVPERVDAILKEIFPHFNCKILSGNQINVDGKGIFVWPTSISADHFKQNVVDGLGIPEPPEPEPIKGN